MTKFELKILIITCIIGIGLPALACIYQEIKTKDYPHTCCPRYVYVFHHLGLKDA